MIIRYEIDIEIEIEIASHEVSLNLIDFVQTWTNPSLHRIGPNFEDAVCRHDTLTLIDVPWGLGDGDTKRTPTGNTFH